jgi:hypothetical protein
VAAAQLYVAAPVTESVTVFPKQTVVGDELVIKVGVGLTITVIVVDPVPQALVP